MMTKIGLLLLVALLGQMAFVQAQSLEKGRVKELLEDFVPGDWKVLLHEQGDLNKDGIDDHVLVVEDTDPANKIVNDGLGMDTLNLNPRMLLVFFKTAAGYELAAKNDRSFVPAEHERDSPCLADPLLTDGGIGIEKGLLKIDFNYWLSCGSWYVNNASYTFRYQNNGFELIGFDHQEFHRSSGERSATSINFSTGKKSETSQGNMFDDAKDKPRTTWSTFEKRALRNLEDCDDNTYFAVLEIER